MEGGGADWPLAAAAVRSEATASAVTIERDIVGVRVRAHPTPTGVDFRARSSDPS